MKVQNRVEQLLSNSQQVRDSDHKLLLNFWHTEGLHLTKEQMDIFLNCTPAESITRARRLLKEKYPASEAVTELRYKKFLKYNGGEIE